jgi:hypothetical protein
MAERDGKGRFVKGDKPEPGVETVSVQELAEMDIPSEDVAPAQAEPPVLQEPPPKLRVQRMGKMFRIVYEETRNLARYNSGEAVDAGGFADQLEGQIYLAKVMGGPGADSEEEVVGR